MGEHEHEPAPGPQEASDFQVYVPTEQEVGVYSNFLAVWHSPYEFTLDFCATQPPQPSDPEDPEAQLVVPCRVVARVKIPVTLIFDLLRALNDNMTRYEAAFGEIRRPSGDEPEAK